MSKRRMKRKKAEEQRKQETAPRDPDAAMKARLQRLARTRQLHEKREEERRDREHKQALAAKAKRPVMLVIAEKACGPREIRKILEEKAADLASEGKSRRAIVAELHRYCDLHDYGDFQRRKTITDVAKRAVDKRQVRRWREWELRNTASRASQG